jgi:hypothetical protein
MSKIVDRFHFNVNELRPDLMEEAINWVRSLGLEPKDFSPVGLIAMGEQRYELHLTKYVRNEKGRIRLDLASERAVTTPVVLELGTKPNWPASLGSFAANDGGAPKAADG